MHVLVHNNQFIIQYGRYEHKSKHMPVQERTTMHANPFHQYPTKH